MNTDAIWQDGISLPYSVWDNTTEQGMKLLTDSHAQLMRFHETKNITFDAKTTNTLPAQAVVAFWDPSVTWAGGAWHSKARHMTESLSLPARPSCCRCEVYTQRIH